MKKSFRAWILGRLWVGVMEQCSGKTTSRFTWHLIRWLMDCNIFISVHNVTKYAIKVGYHANNCDWCDYVLSWRDWYNRISTHPVTSLIWCGTCKFATFQGFVIKWIHNPARNLVSGYKMKWESTKYRSKVAVGTYELSIENWSYGSDETYPKRVLQDFKKVPFFLKIAYFAPLNALRANTAWSKKQPFYSVFLVTPAYNITLEWAPPGCQLPYNV